MNRFLLSTALCTLGFVYAGAANAQTVPNTPAQQEAQSDPNAIVITAQRREQSAQDVGIALSVVTGDQLVKRGITNVNQLQEATPNLEVEPAFGGGAAQFRLRGVGFQDYATNNSPTVGVYVNDVAYPVPVMTQGLIFDIARVEILRGPQGTLYGRNTTGGAINFITNKPTSRLGAGGTIEYGRFDALKAEGYVNAPLGNIASFRISGMTEQGGGYQHNRVDGRGLGDANRWGVRGLLKLDPSPELSALIDVHAGRDKSEAIGLYLINPLHTRNGHGPTIPADTDRFATGWGVSPALIRDAGLSPNQKPGRNNKSWGTSLNLTYDFGPALFTTITSYEKLKREEFGDWDSSPSIEADTFFGSNVHVFSEEARFSSHPKSRFTWVAGVYYSAQNLDERYFSDFIDIFGTYGRVKYNQKVHSISAFGQAEYAVTNQLSLIGGLRYEEETRKLNGFGTAFGGATALPPTDVSTKMKPLTGKAEIQYKIQPNFMVYVSASRGVKSGGFTTYNTGNSSAIQPFKPEVLWAYEGGFKSDFSRAFQLNGAAYYYDYRNQQVLSAVYGVNGPVGRFANVPKSRIWGVELESTLHPAHGLTISQYASYKSGKYLDFFDLDVPASRAAGHAVYVDKSGQRIPFPHWSYGGSINYDMPVGAYVVSANGTYSYRDRYPSWLGTTYDVKGYWLANAEVSLAPASGAWQAALWARNIFNKKYDLTRNFFTSADIAQPGRPRSYGIRLSFKY
jgi:outer membrane receptor protein involved in Fe transport